MLTFLLEPYVNDNVQIEKMDRHSGHAPDRPCFPGSHVPARHDLYQEYGQGSILVVVGGHWVEGAWKIIAGALLAFMLMKVIGAKREVLEKWMYIEVALVMFTGILGTGHRLLDWIGTPKYWLWIGGFSPARSNPFRFSSWCGMLSGQHRNRET